MAIGILLVTHPGIGPAMLAVATKLLRQLPLKAEAFEVPRDTPEQFAAHIKADLPKWAKVVKDAGIKPN